MFVKKNCRSIFFINISYCLLLSILIIPLFVVTVVEVQFVVSKSSRHVSVLLKWILLCSFKLHDLYSPVKLRLW